LPAAKEKQAQGLFPALDGIRGIAFLLVFVIHYVHIPSRVPEIVRLPFFLLYETGWFLVPLFFVLSGFLITRLLIRTRDRGGFFRIFYLHRAIRIFPLYYLIVGAVALIAVIGHSPLPSNYVLFPLYLQNLVPALLDHPPLPYGIDVSHLWSMAVEEQFYILWPLAVWFHRSEGTLLRFCFWLIALSMLARFAWPLFHASPLGAYVSTATRGDAIILGAVLAILYSRADQWSRLVKIARVLTPGLWVAAIVATLVRGEGRCTDYFGIAVMIPVMNLIGAGFVILAIEPVGVVNRLCAGSLICRFGKLSYGMYLLHMLFSYYIQNNVVDAMSAHLPVKVAKLAGIGIGLGLTWALAAVAYKFVETPLMALKKRFAYGPPIEARTTAKIAEAVNMAFNIRWRVPHLAASVRRSDLRR
jgi:peptidoglycan/LPS O-acetylase OafA/YrhL